MARFAVTGTWWSSQLGQVPRRRGRQPRQSTCGHADPVALKRGPPRCRAGRFVGDGRAADLSPSEASSPALDHGRTCATNSSSLFPKSQQMPFSLRRIASYHKTQFSREGHPAGLGNSIWVPCRPRPRQVWRSCPRDTVRLRVSRVSIIALFDWWACSPRRRNGCRCGVGARIAPWHWLAWD